MNQKNVFQPNRLVLLLKRAIALHQQGRLQEALKIYWQVLRENPNNFEALHGTGTLFGQTGHFEKAWIFFTKAAAVQPRNYLVYYNQGRALQELKRHADALVSYETALTLNPEHVDAYN